MPETRQRINDTQEDDQKAINLRNERKRILVADELEQHPVFKTLKISAKPKGAPGCPEFAFCTISALKNLRVFACSCKI